LLALAGGGVRVKGAIMQVREFEPDWVKRYTAAQAEADLTFFKFKGPGWYVEKYGTMLVVPDAEVKYSGSYKDDAAKGPWRSKWPKSQAFWFFYYDGRNPAAAFNALANAPTRVD
jgi:hypothetical protein